MELTKQKRKKFRKPNKFKHNKNLHIDSNTVIVSCLNSLLKAYLIAKAMDIYQNNQNRNN